MYKRFFAVALILLPLVSLAYTSPGRASGFVNDFAGLLSEAARSNIEEKLTSLEKQTGSEVALVTVPSLGGEPIEDYAVKLFEEWKIGKERADNGLLLLISRDDREMRIEVGYGLEPIVTDIESAHIISDVMVPAFRQGDYDSGVSGAVDRIITDIEKGEPMDTEPVGASRGRGLTGFSQFGFYALFFIVTILARVLGRTRSWWLGGVIGGVTGLIIGFFFGFLFAGLVATVVLIPLGLLFDYLVSRAIHDPRGPRPPWFMGGGGFGGGSNSGFGGFGGGSSGGGGASGRW